MRGFVDNWLALSVRQQIMAVVATLSLVAGMWFMISLATKEQNALLFSGLDTVAAGDLAAELDSMGVPYELRGNAVYVPESQRDRLRLEMARQGLPASSTAGYELLDNLNGFSTTSEMFDASYWRAKEGELTRTIVAMPQVKAARVHLGVTRQSAFRRRGTDRTASVTVDAPTGLTPDQARSVQFLTALAVADLAPDNVAVIDTQRGVVAGLGAPNAGPLGMDVDSRETDLEQRLTRLLEAHVGVGGARVTVAMEIDRQSMAQTERLIDPDSRQISSRSISEERDRELGAGGPVTVASNLPDGDAATPAEDDPSVLRTRRDEQVTYTGTEIERRVERMAGAVERLSIAVLLDERTMTDEEGNLIPQPRTAEELAALEALVASAVGLTPDRGDSLTIRTLPFERPVLEPAEPSSLVDSYVLPNAVSLIQLAFAGIMTLLVGLLVLKPAFTPKQPAAAAAAVGADGAPALAGGGAAQVPDDAAGLLTMLTNENPENVAAILDAWFEEDEEEAA